MIRRPLLYLFVLLIAVTNILSAETARVVAVVDGDTIKVELSSSVETIRLIGVDTPETVHPQKPVEHFGKEASAFTNRMAIGKIVRLEGDADGANRDKYGRLLRYVFLPDGKLLNAEIIAQGYGFAYTRFPFTRMEEFRGLERQARESNLGLWDAPQPPSDIVSSTSVADSSNASEIVFITRTGTKYHRAGCRYLAKSSIPIGLKDAASRYGTCSVCAPPAYREVSPAPRPIGPAEGTTATLKVIVPPKPKEDASTVYVTRTGSKYHLSACRYLSKSKIPLSLKDAAARYQPCSVCGPPVPKPNTTPAP
ncbi:MAG: thermonuclease family protein [Candidatus Polarisedimenticolia bacterium]